LNLKTLRTEHGFCCVYIIISAYPFYPRNQCPILFWYTTFYLSSYL